MSAASLNQNSNVSFAEPFLGYLNTGLDKPIKTLCENGSSKYHDSYYRWCRVCDKMFCIKCSMDHLINNQINHCPYEKVFLSKENLDIEFNLDFGKAKQLINKVKALFNSDNSDISSETIKSLKDVLNQFQSLANDLFNNIIPKFIKKYNDSIENLKKSLREAKTFTLNKEKVKIRTQEIFKRYESIENNNLKSKEIQSKTQLKHYYEELMNSYHDLQSFNELIDNNCNNNSIDSNQNIKKEYNIINSNLTQAITIIDGFKKDLLRHINN